MSITLTGNISPPTGTIPAAGDRVQSRSAANRSADGAESLADVPKGPKADTPPGVIRAHPTTPTEDMLQSLRDQELLAKRDQSTGETKSKAAEAGSARTHGTRNPYDSEPETSHNLDIVG
jgi:hypothetical protein